MFLLCSKGFLMNKRWWAFVRWYSVFDRCLREISTERITKNGSDTVSSFPYFPVSEHSISIALLSQEITGKESFCVKNISWEIFQGLTKRSRLCLRLKTAHANDSNLHRLLNCFFLQTETKTTSIKTNNIFISRLKRHAQAHPLNLG